MSPSTLHALGSIPERPDAGAPVVFAWAFEIDAPILFEVNATATCRDAQGAVLWTRHLHDDGEWCAWLPRGRYRIELMLPRASFPQGAHTLQLVLVCKDGPEPLSLQCEPVALHGSASGDGLAHARFSLSGDPDPAGLSWRRGHEDWFFRHFDHAATTIGGYLLKDSPLLRGRILDVGCGEGITDLGLFLRYRPELLVGIDPFGGFDRLQKIVRDNGIALDPWPEQLRFMREDANHLPFADDSFDVVISWGSLEHIAGGYGQALREIKRVLRPDGLLFAHPGLYYGNYGNHLGEFSDEPFVHLKLAPEALRDLVLNGTPRYIDRAGEFSTPEQYWQWYTELNPITVSGFEQVLRALDFEPWRVAIRTEDIIEYTPEILTYPMQDLATLELYVACWNRKSARPQGIRTAEP